MNRPRPWLRLKPSHALERVYQAIVKGCAGLIRAGRRAGSIPPGPPAPTIAFAFVGAVEGAVIQLAGQAPHDETLAVRTAAGVLGLDDAAAFV